MGRIYDVESEADPGAVQSSVRSSECRAGVMCLERTLSVRDLQRPCLHHESASSWCPLEISGKVVGGMNTRCTLHVQDITAKVLNRCCPQTPPLLLLIRLLCNLIRYVQEFHLARDDIRFIPEPMTFLSIPFPSSSYPRFKDSRAFSRITCIVSNRKVYHSA